MRETANNRLGQSAVRRKGGSGEVPESNLELNLPGFSICRTVLRTGRIGTGLRFDSSSSRLWRRIVILEYARKHDFRIDDFIEATASGQASEKLTISYEFGP